MSEFVLNRKYELQLLESFVDIDREEMEYVDGGYHISNTQLQKICWSAGVALAGVSVTAIQVSIYNSDSNSNNSAWTWLGYRWFIVFI